MSKFITSLHTHVQSLYDAHIDANSLVNKIIEMGGKGIAVTDHGTLSAIEEYKEIFKDNNLKFIPGVELYIDGGILGRTHLILLAKNDHGYKGICKIVTESNKNIISGFPIVKEEILFREMQTYNNDIICLTGCMQGVICSILLQNHELKSQTVKLYSKMADHVSPESKKYKDINNRLISANQALDSLNEEKEQIKYWANMKYVQRKKNVDKLIKNHDPNAQDAERKLKEDMNKTESAIIELDRVNLKISEQKKVIKEINQELKKISESVDKYNELNSEIKNIEAQMYDETTLYEMAKKKLLQYKEMFRDNLYAEIQYHGIEQEKICFPTLIKLAHELNVPLVATNDVHILDNSESERLKRSILKSLRFKSNSAKFMEESAGEDQLYLKDDVELADWLEKICDKSDVDEAINNISIIFDNCNVEFKTEKHYPVYDKNQNADLILDQHIQEGIKKKFPKGLDKEHEERLAYETKIIKQMGYSNYHLIVEDYLKYGRLLGYVPSERIKDAPLSINELEQFIKDNEFNVPGFTTGPGRGSAVGSLVCYLLDIVKLDPIDYGLLFERFLNPERISMPDIDCDFANEIREKCIDYIKHKYGEMAVCGIMTVTKQGPKGALRIAAKYYGLKKDGIPLTSLGDSLAKEIPDDVGTKFDTIFDGISVKDKLIKDHQGEEDALNVINWALSLEGIFTQYGAHAAGVVISDNTDISDYIPLRWNDKLNLFTTQCDMGKVEENGLLKFDFLGLKTLDIITQTIRHIKNEHDIVIDPLKIDLNDKKIYKNILSEGKTKSVFQFESSGMISMLQRFKPSCFEDLIILVAMYRPGPMQYLDDVIKVKSNEYKARYIIPALEPILSMTYGAIVYQEQVMQICQTLAGFSLGHADEVRRYMSKKKHDKLAHERENFVEGCKQNNISPEKANTLFDQMEDFASYAFNKSHAAAYAYLAYITAWFKYYYPVEFFTSALNWADKDTKILRLIFEASNMGIKILPPDVNTSYDKFTIENKSIRFGLSSIKGVSKVGTDIINERNKGIFLSLKDFYFRVKPDIKVITNLINTGACDRYNKNRKSLLSAVNEYREKISDFNKCKSFIESAECLLPVIETLQTDDEVIDYQKEHGHKVEIDKLTTANKLEKRLDNKRSSFKRIQQEIDMIQFLDIPEDHNEKMRLEKKYLGLYITDHPMNYYPSPEELGIQSIQEVTKNTKSIYGVITDLVIKERKTDKAKMAFFSLEDKSDKIEVCMFTQAYQGFGSMITEGSVIRLNGNINIEIWENSDGEINETMKFIANSASKIFQKKSTYMLETNSLYLFHIDEDIFRKEYEAKDGHPLMILDRSLGELRKMHYKVSDKVRKLPNFQEIFI